LSQFCAGAAVAAAWSPAAGGCCEEDAFDAGCELELACANTWPAGSVSAAIVKPAARSDLNVIDIPWGSRAIQRFFGRLAFASPSMGEFGQ
jgi:hypothetical protein